jgi:hypothetical protein
MTISNALDSAGRSPGSSGSGTFPTETTLEIFHEAGKHPDVMEVLNIMHNNRENGRKNIFSKSQGHLIQTNSIYPGYLI